MQYLDEDPLLKVSEHVYQSRAGGASTWFLLSESGKALSIDYGYHSHHSFGAGYPYPRNRRSLLHGIKALEQKFGINDQPSRLGQSWPALTFALSDKRTLELRGVIDLLELAQDPQSDSSLRCAVVYDYKRSREKKFKLAEAYHGLDLQLLIYLLAVRQLAPKALAVKAVEPIGGFYVSLKTPTIPKGKPGQEQDEDDLLIKSRPRGLFRSDKLSLIDNTETGTLRAVHATITKGGSFSKAGGDWLTADDFELLLSYASTKIHALAHKILNGLIGVQPSRLAAKIPCTYCPYRWLCRVEPLTRPYRELPTMNKEQALENMRQSK